MHGFSDGIIENKKGNDWNPVSDDVQKRIALVLLFLKKIHNMRGNQVIFWWITFDVFCVGLNAYTFLLMI